MLTTLSVENHLNITDERCFAENELNWIRIGIGVDLIAHCECFLAYRRHSETTSQAGLAPRVTDHQVLRDVGEVVHRDKATVIGEVSHTSVEVIRPNKATKAADKGHHCLGRPALLGEADQTDPNLVSHGWPSCVVVGIPKKAA